MKKTALAFAVAGLFVSLAAAAAGKGTAAEAKALLDRAVAAVKADEAKALAAFNDPKGGFVDRDLYVFCFDGNGKMSASGATPDRVGADARTFKGPDGRAIGQEMVALFGKDTSIEYKWMNPATKQVGDKVTFLKPAGNQTCGVGAYK
jgi:signal transduction histidine kinase